MSPGKLDAHEEDARLGGDSFPETEKKNLNGGVGSCRRIVKFGRKALDCGVAKGGV
ncbi:MAG: hypothetical protein ACI8TQ_002496 [Planctomycetota bacterium]